ncbi:hypothetical protein DERF_011359 [Dermatophagoides farinae]|uniref:Uncharacterized protein n=1 Tax=Dermatophagoides farinae TaxID=6954 RepID=A0A922KZD1_DERFA|nr:hypothetical protein DERF_011359 [Dermatophagoides farinae]
MESSQTLMRKKVNKPAINDNDVKEEGDCLKIHQRIERFYRIMRKDFVENIVHLDQLGQQRFNVHDLKRMAAATTLDWQQLQYHFPLLDSKQDVYQYQEIHCLGRSNEQFLFTNGMIKSNKYFDQCIDILCEQYEIFYQLMTECYLTIQLLIQPLHNCNISDHELLMAMIDTFESYRNFAIHQQQSLRSIINGKRSNLITKIATHPQYDDIRQIFFHYEHNKFIRMICDQYGHLYYGYHYVYDQVMKNGNILGTLFRQLYRQTHHKQEL